MYILNVYRSKIVVFGLFKNLLQMWKDAHMMFTCTVWVCVGVCDVMTLCWLSNNHNNCYSNQQWSHRHSRSRNCSNFEMYDLILLSATLTEWSDRLLLSTHEKESVCAHSECISETEWARDLWETVWIFGRIFHTSYFPLCYRIESRARLSGRKTRLTALPHILTGT